MTQANTQVTAPLDKPQSRMDSTDRAIGRILDQQVPTGAPAHEESKKEND